MNFKLVQHSKIKIKKWRHSCAPLAIAFLFALYASMAIPASCQPSGIYSVSIPNTSQIIVSGFSQPFLNGTYISDPSFSAMNGRVVTGWTNSTPGTHEVIFMDTVFGSGLVIASDPPDYSPNESVTNWWWITGSYTYPGGSSANWNQLNGTGTAGSTAWGANINANIDGAGSVYVDPVNGNDANAGTATAPFQSLYPVSALQKAIYPANLAVHEDNALTLPILSCWTNFSFIGNGKNSKIFSTCGQNPNNTAQAFGIYGAATVQGINFSNCTVTFIVQTNMTSYCLDNTILESLGGAIDDTTVNSNATLIIAGNNLISYAQGIVLQTGAGGGNCEVYNNLIRVFNPLNSPSGDSAATCLQNFNPHTILHASGNTLCLSNQVFVASATNAFVEASSGDIEMGQNRYENSGTAGAFQQFMTLGTGIIHIQNQDGAVDIFTNNAFMNPTVGFVNVGSSPFTFSNTMPTGTLECYVTNSAAVAVAKNGRMMGVVAAGGMYYTQLPPASSLTLSYGHGSPVLMTNALPQ